MPAPDLAPDPALSALQADLQLIRAAAMEAGKIAHGYFGNQPQVWWKEGDSPVSEADHAADGYLKETLLRARPDYGWLSEETTDNPERLKRQRVFVVDPIDGTRGFIKGSKKWCVSVAIVENGRPICGVLECPALNETYRALKDGGAWLNNTRIDGGAANNPQNIAGPGNLVKRFASEVDFEIEQAPFVPSLALRLANVADRRLDGAYARANCHDWDIAAADLIIHEAGATLSGLNGDEIIYNRVQLTHGVLVAGWKPFYRSMLRAAQIEVKQE